MKIPKHKINVIEQQIKPVLDAILAGKKTLTVSFAHLKPDVLVDTATYYKAKYVDNMGAYVFEIRKKGQRWVVKSDGVKCAETDDAKYLMWNFENQLAFYVPNVLK